MFKHKLNLKTKITQQSTCSTVKTPKWTNSTNIIPLSDEDLCDDTSIDMVQEKEEESTFVSPKRKIAKAGTPVPTHQRYILDPSQLCKQNQFSVLSDHSYASFSNMDSAANIKKASNNQNKIPPIFLHEVNNHQEIIKDIKSNVANEFSTTVKGTSLKINLSDITDFRKLTSFYEQTNVKFHTFQSVQDKKLEVVIRNVPCSLSENEIESDLLAMNYPVCKVVRLLNKQKFALPLCVVELENNENGQEIFKLDKLSHAIVSVEPKRKNRDIPQCTRCQRYGHTKNFCHLDPRCVRCTGNHHYSKCPLSKDVTPTCINCGEHHTANFRGCSHYQSLLNKTKNSNLSKTKRLNRETSTELKQGNPTIKVNSQPTEKVQPEKRGASYADVVNGKHSSLKSSLRSRSSSPTSPKQTNESERILNTEQPCSTNLESLIVELVKSIIPLIKTILGNVITSFINNGSI